MRTYHWSAMDVVQVREYQLQEICTSPGAYVVLTRQLRSDSQELKGIAGRDFLLLLFVKHFQSYSRRRGVAYLNFLLLNFKS